MSRYADDDDDDDDADDDTEAPNGKNPHGSEVESIHNNEKQNSGNDDDHPRRAGYDDGARGTETRCHAEAAARSHTEMSSQYPSSQLLQATAAG